MDFIILGLLILKGRTIYELRKRIDEGLNLMYSCSTGSIQAAIKKLLNGGYIGINYVFEGGKEKKYYSATEEGKAYFTEWVQSPMQINSAKNPELAKLYFMGFSEKSARAENIKKYIEGLEEAYAKLQLICDEGDALSAENGGNDLIKYQLLSAKYGRDFIKFNIDWYKNLYAEEVK